MIRRLLCIVCALAALAMTMTACVGNETPAATPTLEATATPTLAPTPTADVLPDSTASLDASLQLDGDIPTGVRNVAISLATLSEEQIEVLQDYVFGDDITKTNLYEDSWDDNGVINYELKQWEMKDPDDMRLLTISNTGEIMFDRSKEPADDGLVVSVETVRAQVIELLTALGLPTDINEGKPTLLPEDIDVKGLGLYPEYVFELNPVEGFPISQMCALRVVAASNGEELMAFSFNGIKTAKPVGGELTLITQQAAFEAIAIALAESSFTQNIQIEDVHLCYEFRRVRGQPDAGLLVPAWEFSNPTGESFLVDAVSGAALGGYGEEVVAEASQLQ